MFDVWLYKTIKIGARVYEQQREPHRITDAEFERVKRFAVYYNRVEVPEPENDLPVDKGPAAGVTVNKQTMASRRGRKRIIKK